MDNVLVIHLGGDRAGLWRAVAQRGRHEHVAVVSFGTTLADDVDLDVLSEEVGRYQAADVAADERVAHARERAWRWLDEVAHARQTGLGRTLAELVVDDEGESLWSLGEITLQEPTYLAVRFVETLDAWARRLAPDRIVVTGWDDALPWQTSVVVAWARARALKLEDRPSAGKARERLPLAPFARVGHPIFLDARTPPSALLDVVARAVELVIATLAAPIVAVFVVFGLAIASALPRGLAEARRALALMARVVLLVVALVAGVVLVIPLAIALVVLSWLAIVRADRPLDLGDVRRAVSGAGMSSLRRLLPRARTIGAPAGLPVRRILAVEDEGNARLRVGLDRSRARYNPYLEGVIPAVERARGRYDVLVARYGSPPVGRLQRGVRRVLRRLGVGDLNVVDLITPELWEAAGRWRVVHEETGRALLAKGIGDVLTYEGVPLAEALRDAVGTVFSILHERVLYVHAFTRLLRDVSPAAVVAYNWEGVFRPLTRAAAVSGVPLVGVQQALGPYGHALDHRSAGYASSGPIGQRFPIPDLLLLWGELHESNLSSYGYPRSSLVVTGYPRLDPFVRAVPDRAALRARLRIARPDAKIVLFTPVLRVVGTGLVRERDYIASFETLVRLTLEDPSVFVIVKPWAGDDLVRVREIVGSRGSDNVRYIPPDTELHNADLLTGADVLVGTFSSIVGEAVVAGCVPIVMDFPECRYYFGSEHVAYYEGVAQFVDAPQEIDPLVRRALALTSEARAREREAALSAIVRIFGRADGHSAERAATEIMRFADAERGARAV